jgi:hypothetical protein
MQFQSSQNQLLTFQVIPVRPKPTSSILSHSSQAKIDFLHSKPFQAGQNGSPPFQAISVRPKLTSFQPILFRTKPTFAAQMPLQSGQNRLPPFQVIPVRSILSIILPSSPCFFAAGHQTFQFLFFS